MKGKVEAGKEYVKGKVEAGKAWVKGKLPGKGPTAGGNATQTAALAEADQMLISKPPHANAVSKVADIARRHATRLNLVVEKREGNTEHVHVQTMATPTRPLPAAVYDPTTQTQPQLWRDMKPDQRPGESPQEAQTRSGLAREHLAANHFAAQRAAFEAMTDPATTDYGARPRPFTDYETELTYNANSHVGERHVLGEGCMPSEPFLAIRAICHRIRRGGAWVNSACGGLSSAFMTGRDANASLRGFYDSVMVPNWEQIRIEILTQGYRRYPGQALRGRATQYVRAPGPVQPLGALPAYLNGRYGLPVCNGTRPLYPDDPALDTGIPMSDPGNPQAFLAAVNRDGASPGGWYIDSAYPQ